MKLFYLNVPFKKDKRKKFDNKLSKIEKLLSNLIFSYQIC